jgi:hypothetical protein
MKGGKPLRDGAMSDLLTREQVEKELMQPPSHSISDMTWSLASEHDVVPLYDFLHDATISPLCSPVVAHDSVSFFHGYAWGLVTVLVFVVIALWVARETIGEKEE